MSGSEVYDGDTCPYCAYQPCECDRIYDQYHDREFDD